MLSDEVYEHMVFDGARHASIVAHPELYDRGVAVFSFGKTMHATGWRVGYTVARRTITREIRRVHQFNTFSIAAPLQHAIADFLKKIPGAQCGLGRVLPAQARPLPRALRDSSFSWTPSPGTYFQLLDFSAVSTPERCGVRRHAAARGRCRRDSDLALLCSATEAERPAFLLREERFHTGRSCGAALQGVEGSSWTLRVTLVQAELAWHDPDANRRRFEQLLLPLAGRTDLVVLPEMFTTGFTMAAASVAEPARGPTLDWLRIMAARMNAIVTGSVATQDGKAHFNRLIWMGLTALTRRTTSATCSAWLTSMSITRRGHAACSSTSVAGGSARCLLRPAFSRVES